MDSNIITLIFSGIVAVSTVFYVVLTARLVKETRIMRKSQVEPHIIAYLDVAEAMTDVVFIKIQNIGVGVALDVKFTIHKDINYPRAKSLNKLFYFTEGVNFFPPKHEDSFFLLGFQGDTETKMKDYISLGIEYRSILNETKKHLYTLRAPLKTNS